MSKNNLMRLQKLNASLLRLFVAGSFVLLFMANSFSQTQLELAGASYTGVPLGLTTASQTATLLENTSGATFSSFNPSITVTASISNQQYNNISTNRVSTSKGINFGGRVNSITPVATQVPVYNSLNANDNPINAHFTSNPNGPTSTGINVADNYGFYFYNSVDELFTNNDAVNGRYYFGNITLTFSQPVSNPVIHINGLGCNIMFGPNNKQGITSELELQTGGVSLSKLSGSSELNITANKILNNAAFPSYNCGTGAACGSVKVAGTNITTLTFKVYVRGDGNGTAWSHSAINAGDEFMMSVSMNSTVYISGNVFNDANGLGDNTVNGIGTNVGGTLYAILVDSLNKVVATTAIAADGTYLFDGVSAGNYNIILSTTQGVQGTNAPAASLPTAWINTGENIGASAGSDGMVNGILPITVTTTGVANANFGIYLCPNIIPTISVNGLPSACLGAGLTLTSSAATSYQWYKDGVAIIGANAQTYIPIVSGTYTNVVITGGGICNAVSNAITVSISYAVTPSITPADTAIICVANHDKICPAVWGYSNYQWYKNGVLIAAPDGTSSCLYPTSEGNYTITAQNGSGCWSLPSTPVYVKIDSICSSIVTSGGGGGVETKPLGDVIAERLYGNAFNSRITDINYLSAQAFIHNSNTVVNGVKALTLSDLMPTSTAYTTNAFNSTPNDLTQFTNAVEILAIDYTKNSNCKAVAFGTQTLGDVYGHTKPVCDRLKEAKLLEATKLTVEGFEVIGSKLQQRTGEVEYCINFSIGKDRTVNGYSLQSNWLTDNYSPKDTMYNFQVWAVSYDISKSIVAAIINKIKAAGTLVSVANSTNDLPQTYIENIAREKNSLQIQINNKTANTTGYFEITEKQNEFAASTKKLVPFTVQPYSKSNVQINVNDAYEHVIYTFVNNKKADLVYMTDGAWNIDYSKSTTTLKKFDVTNNAINNVSSKEEYPLFRKVNIAATTKDYITAYKLVKGGGIERDFSNYNTVKFSTLANGVGTIKVTLIKKGITNWAEQYSYKLQATNTETEYSIPVTQFISKTNSSVIDLKDITAINFTWENNSGGFRSIDATINKLRFAKGDAIVAANDAELGIYPNPNTGKFMVNFIANEVASAVIRITEVGSGKVIHTQFISTTKGTNTVGIDVKAKVPASGYYIVTLDGDGLNYKGKKVMINKN
jgi:hypothetical protein